jgi:hypothetical protein
MVMGEAQTLAPRCLVRKGYLVIRAEIAQPASSGRSVALVAYSAPDRVDGVAGLSMDEDGSRPSVRQEPRWLCAAAISASTSPGEKFA